jgi:cytochrome b6-f complex iron-sulfur subunit
MDRKSFIKSCGIACMSTSMIALLMESCASTNHFATVVVNDKKLMIKKSEFIHIEKEKTIERKFVLVKTDKLSFPICLFKLNDNEYSAVLMECTHNSCELHNQGEYLVCPCHGSEFSNKGVVQNPPAENNLISFKTMVEKEEIIIILN